MTTFRSRRLRNVAILCAVCLLILFVYGLLAVSLRPTSFYSGWALFGSMLLLTGYNVFKKLPFLNLASSATWLQFHIYVGWLTVLLFALHLGMRAPHNTLGFILTTLYVGVAGSGILGLFLSRGIPLRLRARGEEVLYERIPVHRRQLQEKVEELVLRSVQTTDSTSITDFYVRRLKDFFDGPRHFWRHLLHANLARRRALLAEAQDQLRYMNAQERELMADVIVLIQAKDDLDYQYALQSALKFWLFAHIPLTYSLLIFSLFHIFVVYTFSGVIRVSTPLPVIQTDTSTYERPTQPWVCGRAAEGTPCQLGPDSRGHCRTTAECRPARKGDGWVCSRPAACGGPCTEGPAADGTCTHPVPPCRPVRSLRKLRGLVTCCAAVLSVGILCWLVGGHFTRQNIASPGDLSFKHGTVTQTCAACHAADIDNPVSWMAMATREHGGAHESQLCLNCHQMGQDALAPHGLTPAALADIHHQIAGQPDSSATTPLLLGIARHWPGQPQKGGELACALCHREHKGKDAKLAGMDDQRCQACHMKQFPSFGNGHPEFAGYPYHRRTRLAYDHVSHLGRHYQEYQRMMPDGKAPTSCLDCHEQGPGGRMMLLRGFERSCASCHLSQIEDVSLGGVTVLNLPGLDIKTLGQRQEAATVGEWPETASGDLSPFMRLLLSTDARFVHAEKVLHNVNLRDLRGANAAQLKAVEDYVWAIKTLFYELTHDEAMVLRLRLEKVLECHLDVHDLSSMTGDLPRELLRETQSRWLPDLTAEVEARHAPKVSPGSWVRAWGLSAAPSGQGPFLAIAALLSEPNPLRNRPAPKPPPQKFVPLEVRRRWFADDVAFALSFRPKGHAGDFMRTWLDHSAKAPCGDDNGALRAVFVQLSDPFGPGRCMKCHSVDRAGEGVQVNWLTNRPQADEHPFTKFAHFPHFSLLGEKGCRTCHVLNEQADVGRGFMGADHSLNTDPRFFESSFTSMGKATCATCHVQKAAGDSCLTCHNYHVGRLPLAKPNARFPGGGGEP